MTLNMRLEEPNVISVSSQVFRTQTIAGKTTLLRLTNPFPLLFHSKLHGLTKIIQNQSVL